MNTYKRDLWLFAFFAELSYFFLFVGGCTDDGGLSKSPDSSVADAALVSDGLPRDSLVSDTLPADGGTVDSKPMHDGPPRISVEKCGTNTNPGGTVSCCPDGEDCKITMDPAMDYCDCKESPPTPERTWCQVGFSGGYNRCWTEPQP